MIRMGILVGVMCIVTAFVAACGAQGTSLGTSAAPSQGAEIVTATLSAAKEGESYIQNVAATGGIAPYVWTSESSLPAGLAFVGSATTARIEGTPGLGAAGSYAVKLKVADALGRNTGRDYVLTVQPAAVAPLEITTLTLPPAVEGSTYSAPVGAQGGVGSYSWSLGAATAPPSGVAFNPVAAVFEGVPAVGSAGTYPMTVHVADAAGASVAKNFDLVVSAQSSSQPLVIGSATLPAAYEGYSYSTQVSASGGIQPYIFSLIGLAPAGIVLGTSTGVLSGMLGNNTTGSYFFSIVVTDVSGITAMGQFSLTVLAVPPLTLPQALPYAVVGTPYDVMLAASGGSGSYTWHAATALPPNFVLETSGRLHGTPGTAATHSIGLDVTDIQFGISLTAAASFTIFSTAPPPLMVEAGLPKAGRAGGPQVYSWNLRVSGGTAPYTFGFVDRGTLPLDWTLSTSGLLSGFTSSLGMGSPGFEVYVTDAQGIYQAQVLTLETVSSSSGIMVANTAAPLAYEGLRYSFIPTVAAPLTSSVLFRWRLIASNLPSGFKVVENSMSATHIRPEIFGMPAYLSVGSYSVTFEISGPGSTLAPVSQTITLDVAPAPFQALQRPAMTEGYTGQPYHERIFVGGGAGGTQMFVKVSGDFPPGISINAVTGELYGTLGLNSAGTHMFTIEATQAGLNAKTRYAATVVVHPAPATGNLIPFTGFEIPQAACWDDEVPVGTGAVGDVIGMAFDAQGNLIFTEARYSSRIRKIDMSSSVLTTLSGGRSYGHSPPGTPASNAGLWVPYGMTVAAGTIYYAQASSTALFSIGVGGAIEQEDDAVYTSSGFPLSPLTADPSGTHVYIGDSVGGGVFDYDTLTGTAVNLVMFSNGGYTGDGGPANQAMIGGVWGLGCDAQGNLYIASNPSAFGYVDPSIRVIAADPTLKRPTGACIISTVPGTRGIGDYYYASNIVFDQAGDMYFFRFNNGGGGYTDALYRYSFGGGGQSAVATMPVRYGNYDNRGIAIDPASGDIYLAGEFNPQSQPPLVMPQGIQRAYGIGTGMIYKVIR